MWRDMFVDYRMFYSHNKNWGEYTGQSFQAQHTPLLHLSGFDLSESTVA